MATQADAEKCLICDRPAVAVLITPTGARRPVCPGHQQIAAAASRGPGCRFERIEPRRPRRFFRPRPPGQLRRWWEKSEPGG